jgi:hypothetical protein
MYRCVKSNTSNEVIAIGMDENQGDVNYNDIGVWEDFTFETIPTPGDDIFNYIDEYGYMGSLLNVVDNVVVVK